MLRSPTNTTAYSQYLFHHDVYFTCPNSDFMTLASENEYGTSMPALWSLTFKFYT